MLLGSLASGVSPKLLTVDTRSQVRVAPDIATVVIAAIQQGSSASAAQTKVDTIAQRLAAQAVAMGVPRREIETSGLTLKQVAVGELGSGLPSAQAGFEARVELAIRVSDFGLIRRLLDDAVASGANEIVGVRFSLVDEIEARKSALRQAVAESREKARAIAEALGMKVVGVYEVHENEGYDPRSVSLDSASFRAGALIEPGLLTVSAGVTVRYVVE